MRLKVSLAILALLLLLAPPARADETLLFQHLSGNGTFGCGVDPTTGNVIACDLNGWSTASFQVTGESGTALANVSFQCRNTANDSLSEVFSITNPTQTQIGWNGAPVAGQCVVVVQWNGGQPMRATLVRVK